MKAATVLLLALVAPGCGAREQAPAEAGVPAELVGRYAQGGCVGSLTLEAGGEYESLVFTGVTADGCGTFAGAGVSKGTWSFADGRVAFVPRQAQPSLAVQFERAEAVPCAEGLRFSAGELAVVLRRVREDRPDDDASGGR
jgi:hypothetical protein